MTSEVIDTMTPRCDARAMNRYDRTLRVVMWLDAFWSVAAVLVSVLGSLVVGLLGMPHSAHLAVGITSLVAAVFLAACGLATGVLLMLRMNAGEYTMPTAMHVPLPREMHPEIGPA
jgi:hypothetical protein